MPLCFDFHSSIIKALIEISFLPAKLEVISQVQRLVCGMDLPQSLTRNLRTAEYHETILIYEQTFKLRPIDQC